jgi:tetratricopeptide (TPR) repeat protein
MQGKLRYLMITILFGVVLLSGCESLKLGSRNKTKTEIKKTETQKRKETLLRRINHKYSDPAAHYELGKIYQAEGLLAQAEREYQTALNFDPVYREAQAALVKVLMGIGDNVKAATLADIYLNQAADSAVGSLQLALGFQSQGLDDYALIAYRQSLRLAPTSAKVNRQIGYYYLSKGKKLQAQDYLRRSFELDPYQPDIAESLGRLFGLKVEVPRKAREKGGAVDRLIKKSDKERKQQQQ